MFENSALIKEINSLKKTALRLARYNHADADDLVQATILRAIEKKHLFQEGTSLFGWTSRIMYNLFVSGYRRKSKFETACDADTILDICASAPSQESQVAFNQVGEAMEQLCSEHREVLLMVCVHGMQYNEVAEKLAIPVGTVRSRLSRARDALQALLEPVTKAGRGGDTTSFVDASNRAYLMSA